MTPEQKLEELQILTEEINENINLVVEWSKDNDKSNLLTLMNLKIAAKNLFITMIMDFEDNMSDEEDY